LTYQQIGPSFTRLREGSTKSAHDLFGIVNYSERVAPPIPGTIECARAMRA